MPMCSLSYRPVSTQTETSPPRPPGKTLADGKHPGAPARTTPSPGAVTVIEPSRGWRSLRLSELWEYRELVYFLVWRDIKVRYKQTAAGVLWAVIQPVVLMILFTIIFGHLLHLPHGPIPYPTLVYSGLITWLLFAGALMHASSSIIMNQQLISKVYVPRILIPTAAIFSNIIDTGIGFVVLIGFMFYFGLMPGIALLTLPIWIALALMAALGVGLLLSALNVKYRDVQYTTPFLIQVWFFSTPIVYPLSIFGHWKTFVGLNPMAGVVDGVRWSLFSASSLSIGMVLVSVATTLVLLAVGILYFKRADRSFEDVI